VIKIEFKLYEFFYSYLLQYFVFNKFQFFPFFIILIIFHLASLYFSFHLDKSYECTNNQIEYFNLINHINISYFDKYIKNFNLTKFSENQENYINKIINFTKINEDINFEIAQRKIQIINIILVILNPLIYIAFFIIFIERDIKYINLENKFKISAFIHLFNAISIIFELSNKNIIIRLNNSLLIFYQRIENLFKIKIPDINNDELTLLGILGGAALSSLIGSIILIILMTFKCFKIVHTKKDLNSDYKDLFNK